MPITGEDHVILFRNGRIYKDRIENMADYLSQGSTQISSDEKNSIVPGTDGGIYAPRTSDYDIGDLAGYWSSK